MDKRVTRCGAAVAVAVLLLGGGGAAAADDASGASGVAAAQSQGSYGIRATDVPRVVRVGAAEMVVRVTVITEASVGELQVDLLDPDRNQLGADLVDRAAPGRPTVYKPVVTFRAEDITAWGAHQWSIMGTNGVDVVAAAVAPTEVKAHSMAALRTSRDGGTLRVEGSVRAYHSVQDRYVPWSGREVSVQRWTGSAWVQVTGVRSDVRGNIATSVGAVPTGTSLRLVVKDDRAIWGVVSAAVRAA